MPHRGDLLFASIVSPRSLHWVRSPTPPTTSGTTTPAAIGAPAPIGRMAPRPASTISRRSASPKPTRHDCRRPGRDSGPLRDRGHRHAAVERRCADAQPHGRRRQSGSVDQRARSTILNLGAASNPLQIVAGDDLSIQTGGTLAILFGSDVTANDLSANGLNGTLRVEGAGSTLTLSGAVANLIGATAAGSLIFQNTSTGNTINGSIGLANSSTPSVTGNLSILSGSHSHAGRQPDAFQPKPHRPSRNAHDQWHELGTHPVRRGDDHPRIGRQRHGHDRRRHHHQRRHLHDRHRALHDQQDRHRHARQRHEHRFAPGGRRPHDQRRRAAKIERDQHVRPRCRTKRSPSKAAAGSRSLARMSPKPIKSSTSPAQARASKSPARAR